MDVNLHKTAPASAQQTVQQLLSRSSVRYTNAWKKQLLLLLLLLLLQRSSLSRLDNTITTPPHAENVRMCNAVLETGLFGSSQ